MPGHSKPFLDAKKSVYVLRNDDMVQVEKHILYVLAEILYISTALIELLGICNRKNWIIVFWHRGRVIDWFEFFH